METSAKEWTNLHAHRYLHNMKRAMEIILHDQIQQVFDHFAAAFGISIVFFSLDGQELRRGLGRATAPFCQLVQERLMGRTSCLGMDEAMCRACTRRREMVGYRCHAGIHEAVAPIYVEGQLAGYAMIGQFRTAGDMLHPSVRSASRKKGLEREAERWFAALPCFERAQADHILGLFSLLVDYIVAREIVSLRGERMTGRVLAYIEERYRDRITVADAARSVGRSVSSVSHQLKRVTGRTFVQHLTETRIRRAEQQLRESPDKTVQEAALQSGFTDAYYFSRVYRKFRGCSPGQYRKKPSGR